MEDQERVRAVWNRFLFNLQSLEAAVNTIQIRHVIP